MPADRHLYRRPGSRCILLDLILGSHYYKLNKHSTTFRMAGVLKYAAAGGGRQRSMDYPRIFHTAAHKG